MAEPWIRVHANLLAKPVVTRAAEALGVSRHEALGLLVAFWGAVSQHAGNGRVDHLSDLQLEAWADWRKKRGRFAAFIRSCHLDADGRVNEWDEYAGKLEERREKERNRKRMSRGQSRGHPADSHADSATHARERDETIRNEKEHLQPREGGEAALAALLPTDADRAALTSVVLRAPDAFACTTALLSMMTGNDMATPQPTPEQMGQALRDFAANAARWSAGHFRGYLKRAIPRTESASEPATKTVVARGALLFGKIRELIEERVVPGQASGRFIQRGRVEALGPDVLRAYEAVGGAEKFLNTPKDKLTFLMRDFGALLDGYSHESAA